MEAWDGGAPRVVADYAEAFGLQNLQTAVIGGRCVAPNGGSVCKERANK